MITIRQSLSITCIMAVFLGLSSAQARVSKSFVRGFLVGYAKGLEEGKAMAPPLVHHVACAFHPLPHPEHHEPEPYHGPPPHHEPEPHHEPHEPHGGPHGYSSNAHSTRQLTNGQAVSSVSESSRQNHGIPQPPPSTMIEDKKAAASNAIQKAVLDKFTSMINPVDNRSVNNFS